MKRKTIYCCKSRDLKNNGVKYFKRKDLILRCHQCFGNIPCVVTKLLYRALFFIKACAAKVLDQMLSEWPQTNSFQMILQINQPMPNCSRNYEKHLIYAAWPFPSKLRESRFSRILENFLDILLLDLEAFSFHFSFSISRHFNFTFHSRNEC